MASTSTAAGITAAGSCTVELPPHVLGGLKQSAARAARGQGPTVAVPAPARAQPGSKTKITTLTGQVLMDRCLLLATDLKKLKKADAKRRAALKVSGASLGAMRKKRDTLLVHLVLLQKEAKAKEKVRVSTKRPSLPPTSP